MPSNPDTPRVVQDPAKIPLSKVFSGRHSLAERLALRFLVNYCNPRDSLGDFGQDLNSLTVADIQNFEVEESRRRWLLPERVSYELLAAMPLFLLPLTCVFSAARIPIGSPACFRLGVVVTAMAHLSYLSSASLPRGI